MKKILFVAITLLGINSFAWAQAYEGKIKVKKVEQPALIMVYNYTGDVVENALKAKLADMRLKADKSRGFIVYANSVIPSISTTPLDYSFKIDETGRRGKEVTTVYMLMEGSNALSGDPVTLSANGRAFLENMLPDVERSNIISQIKEQEEVLAKEDKKMKNLKDEQNSLEKKLKDNQKDQEKQQRVINSQQSILNDLKAKQK